MCWLEVFPGCTTEVKALVISGDDFAGVTLHHESAMIEKNCFVAQFLNGIEGVRNQNDGDAPLFEFSDLSFAFLLKLEASHSQDFVDQQNVRIEVGDDGESKS